MQIVEKLREMSVSRLDLSGFVSSSAQTSVADVLKSLRTSKVSAVLVVEGDVLLGVFTERDVLTKIAGNPNTWQQPVADFMTRDPQVMRPEGSINEALQLMEEGHYRNVPILDEQGHVVGNLQQHEVIRFLTDEFPLEVYNLPPDPDRVATTKEGA
ncbi:MAG: CBS domain-containing protein [Candidatus Latescibacterota bacterium]|jgi:CBS domain-containing protein